ncbi:MjaI family restriction endonuclease [Sphingobacterium sp. SGG-5]|nr:MjaI family restriction endonuclease [Sphingobacterium sp. SGG-5]
MNLANSNAQGTRPRVVGQMSDLIQEFPGQFMNEWQTWYQEKHPVAIDNATTRIWNMVQEFQKVINTIDEKMVRDWVEELILVKTFSGLKFQEAILKKIAEQENTTYQLADPSDESKGIDGYIGDIPVSIKPISYKSKILSENISVCMVYYDKKKTRISVEYNLD